MKALAFVILLAAALPSSAVQILQNLSRIEDAADAYYRNDGDRPPATTLGPFANAYHHTLTPPSASQFHAALNNANTLPVHTGPFFPTTAGSTHASQDASVGTLTIAAQGAVSVYGNLPPESDPSVTYWSDVAASSSFDVIFQVIEPTAIHFFGSMERYLAGVQVGLSHLGGAILFAAQPIPMNMSGYADATFDYSALLAPGAYELTALALVDTSSDRYNSVEGWSDFNFTARFIPQGGPGQAAVPDGGSTAALLLLGLCGLGCVSARTKRTMQ